MHFYRHLNPILAMTFDLDDTLYDNRPVIKALEQSAIEWLHQHHPQSATRPISWWQEVKMALAAQHPQLKHDVTQWRFEQVRHGLSLLGYAPDAAQAAAAQLISFVLEKRSDFQVPAHTHQIMAELAQRLPLVGITNGNVDPDRIGIRGYFQAIFKAGPDGKAKPFADLFVKAQQHLHVAPQHILHIGDHLTTDVQGAKCNGLMACWFNDQGQTLRAAAKARILPDVEISCLSELLELI